MHGSDLRLTPARCFSGYGLRIELRADGVTLLERAAARLPPGLRRAVAGPSDIVFALERERRRVTLRRRGRVVARGPAPAMLARLGDELERWVALHARDRIFVHAGVVGWRGRAILLPGRSLAGKSTLVAALVRRGAVYYSDEFALLDERGRVHPFARPLTLRGRARPRRPARVGRRPLSVGLVVLCRYRAGAQFRPLPLSTGRAVLALFKHTVAARSRAEESLLRLSLVARGGAVVQARRGEADPAAAQLLALAAAERRARG